MRVAASAAANVEIVVGGRGALARLVCVGVGVGNCARVRAMVCIAGLVNQGRLFVPLAALRRRSLSHRAESTLRSSIIAWRRGREVSLEGMDGWWRGGCCVVVWVGSRTVVRFL